MREAYCAVVCAAPVPYMGEACSAVVCAIPVPCMREVCLAFTCAARAPWVRELTLLLLVLYQFGCSFGVSVLCVTQRVPQLLPVLYMCCIYE